MKKRWASSLLLGILSVNTVSAAIYSFRDFMDSLDPQFIFLILSFLIIFALLNFALTRTFNSNPRTGTIIALCMSLGVVYGFYYMDLNLYDSFSGFFFDLGISDSTLYTVIPIIILLGIIFMFWKLKSWTLLVLGGILVFASLIGIAAESGFLLTLGIAMIVLFIIIRLFSWRKHKNSYLRSGYGYPKGPGMFARGLKRYRNWRDPRNRYDRWQQNRNNQIAMEKMKKQKEIDKAHEEALEEDKRRQEEGARKQQAQKQAEEQKRRQEQQDKEFGRQRALQDEEKMAKLREAEEQKRRQQEEMRRQKELNENWRRQKQEREERQRAEEEAKKRQQEEDKRGKERKLQEMYFGLAKQNFSITSRYRGRIPPAGSNDGNSYKKNVRRMKAIERLSRKEGLALYNSRGQKIV